jgi:hypothetical protein
MTLINRYPIGSIHIEMDKRREIKRVKFAFPDLKKPEPCWNCKTLTKKTRMGSPECPDCQAYEDCCEQCQFCIPRTTFVSNGEDIEDHVDHWKACGIRNLMGEKLTEFNPESRFSCWGLSINTKKLCFISKLNPGSNPKILNRFTKLDYLIAILKSIKRIPRNIRLKFKHYYREIRNKIVWKLAERKCKKCHQKYHFFKDDPDGSTKDYCHECNPNPSNEGNAEDWDLEDTDNWEIDRFDGFDE